MLCGRLRPHLRPVERALAAPEVPVAAPLARPRRAGRRALQTRAFFRSGAALNVAAVPPPYAQLSTPVYSLSTCDAEGGSQTMNLVTYASPISLKPRQYAMGVFVGTLTHSNFLATGRGTLQVLGEQHAALFNLLGKTSGRDVDKLAAIANSGFPLLKHGDVHVLADSCGWMDLAIVGDPLPSGDHDVVICEVTAYRSLQNYARPLYTDTLREYMY